MKASTVASVVAALAASSVSAHYSFPYLDVAGTEQAAWEYIRMTDNHYSLGPVTDVTTPQIKCYETDTASATSTYTVAAGSTLGITASGPIYHPGYIDVYMSAASPDAAAEAAGGGATWFKIFEDAPVFVDDTTGYVFPSTTSDTVTFTIPAALPSGDYLIRVEQIALHVASSFGGAQFYLGCAQVTVTGGGSGTPGPLVAFPGAYTGNEPGILIDIYAPYPSGAYISPGPPVWTGSGSSSPPPPPHSSSTTSSKPTTTSKVSTTVKVSTTTTSSHPTTTSTGTGAPLYGQCGGTGWAGPFTCAQGTCTVLNAYYSQCT